MDPSNKKGGLPNIVLDEIALEGLEGITLPTLYVYMGKSLNLALPLSKKLEDEIWKLITRLHKYLEFYELPQERDTVKLYDRYNIVDSDLGVPITQDICPIVRYKSVPISDGDILGSCEYYKERKLITIEMVKDLNPDEILKIWGTKFVIVASQEIRYNAITPVNVSRPKELTIVQYCIWEAIGRSRFNGETTSGLWSLTHFCRDSTIVFYIKNKLIRHGVVTHQLFNEKRGERLTVTTLLTLPRFYNTNRSRLLNMVEKLFIVLKEKPEFTMPLLEVRSIFPSFERQKSLKKAMLTHIFRQIFETRSVPYSEIFKNSKSKCSSSQRTVAMVRLRYPEKPIDDLFESLDNEQEKNEDNTDEDFHNEKHSYINMAFPEELYRCVSRYGNRGCSQTEIFRHMAINHLTLRQMIKQMNADGLLRSYCHDVGRQRVNMYVAVEHSDSVNKKVKDSLGVLQSLQCSEEPNIPNEDIQFADIPHITARIKPYEYRCNRFMARENRSHRLMSRKAFTVKTINEKCILPLIGLRKVLQTHEKECGLKDEICQKSIRRMLHRMSESHIINVYEIVLQCEENIRIYRYLTHPKIDVAHDVLKREILKLKNNFFLTLEELRLRQAVSNRFQNKKLKAGKKLKASEVMKFNKNAMIPLKTHKPPKFLISRYLHEFLFYIVVELNECQIPYEITRDILDNWQSIEPSLRISEYLTQLQLECPNIKAFTKDISWRTFIQPLPRYSDKPAGWVYFLDAVDRMPLSIFNKIFHIDKGADDRLSSFLSHPIRQHYLMCHLPSDLQCKISRVQLQRVYISVLKLLNHIGLIQVSERLSTKDPLMTWVYLNRKARVLDTTNTEPAYLKINADREYTPITFDLRSFDDIHQYWTTLQRICVYTKLGFRSRNLGKNERVRELSFLKPIDYDEAPQYDIGYQPGDGLGAAGLSTQLFAHTFRNWSWSVQSSKKLPVRNMRTGRTAGSGLIRSSAKVLRVTGRKSRQQISTIKRAKAQSSTSSHHVKKSTPRDAIDRDALKNMRTLRVSWTKSEDEVLMIAKATAVYVSAPIPSLGLIAMGKVCRDVIRHSLGIYNKTTQACGRRLQFLIRQKRHMPQVPSWLHTLQTNEVIQKKYGDMFLHKLKKLYPARIEFSEVLLIHFSLIMCHLFKHVNNSQEFRTKSRFLLPESIQEFHKRFLERLPVHTDDEAIIYKNPETNEDLQIIVVINVLHSSLCAFRDKTLYNLQAFEIYKHFSEQVLKAAFFKARSDGLAVTIKRQNINMFTSQLAGPAYVLSSKYRLKLLFLRIPYSVYDAFYEYYEDVLRFFFGPNNEKIDHPKDNLELRSPTLGQMFVIGEGLARDILAVDIKLPINILTVDAEQSKTISSMDRILGHYHSIFDNAPEQEYSKAIENEAYESQIRVKFHPANLSYKIHYNPFDLISKLPTRCLHFFCALDCMEQEIDINFSKLQIQDEDGYMVIECPFKCVLKSTDYLFEISRIVEEKKSLLNSLTEMAPQKLLNLATSGLSIKVFTSNLLTLVRMLESYWHEKESVYEHKDLGKFANNIKSPKPINWIELCTDILNFNAKHDDFDRIEEYEPILNKEERVIRAQDVFVVNLPIIQIKLAKNLINDADTMVYNGDLNVPKKLLPMELKRESILKKILENSYWKYTDNNLNDMKDVLKQQGFSEMEQKHLVQIHDFIENKKLGSSIIDLMHEFPYELFLLKALEFLSSQYLVKRVGVSNFVYVHKNHIRTWLVHTFNLKRLERENIGSANVLKRKNDQAQGDSKDLDDNRNNPTKKFCKDPNSGEETEEPSVATNKRVTKPVIRFDPTALGTVSVSSKERDVIVMKPVPWIRLNGSINRRVLDRWLGSILCECIARNGCSVHEICLRFPHMFPTDIMFLLEILFDIGCLKLSQISKCDADIFSQYEEVKESSVPFVYDPDNTFIYIFGDATMRICQFIGKKKYTAEFV